MKRLIAVFCAAIVWMAVSSWTLPQEKVAVSPIVAAAKDVKAKLKTVRTVAIFLTGNDQLLTRLVEDALAIHLTNAGFTVYNRELLEKSVGEQVEKRKKEKAEGAINAVEVGLAVNADSIITGTLVTDSGEQGTLAVKVASFQMIEIPSGKTLLSTLVESEKGKTISESARIFVEILKQNID